MNGYQYARKKKQPDFYTTFRMCTMIFMKFLKTGSLVLQDSIPGSGKRFVSIPQHPDWLWGPPSLLTNAYWGLSGWDMELTTHFH
jgi:hypothetical protein